MAAWALVIHASGMAVGLGFGFSARWWLHLGDDPAETVVIAKFIRQCAYFAVSGLLYWRFATGIASRPWLHAGVLFVLLHVVDYAIAVFAFDAPLRDLVNPASIGGHLLVAAIGVGLSGIRRTRRA